MPNHPVQRVLDLGSGVGDVSLIAARLVGPSGDVVGIERDERSLARATAPDDALDALAALDARKSHVVEPRFFGGLSVEETAEALKVSPETVMRDWKLAKILAPAGTPRGEA